MAALWNDFSSAFWSTRIWLPGNYTWEDLVPTTNDEYYPRLDDMFLPSIGLGFCLLVIRWVYARLVVYPLGRYLGIKDSKIHHLEENTVLETTYRKQKAKKFSTESLLELSKKTSLSERQIQRWMRIRAKQDAPSLMKKFEDSNWHFIFYIVLFWYGLYTLWDKPWFSKTIECWIGWPKQHITNDVYWYYAIELGFYWSLLFSLSTDHKRKDFYEMVTHHLVTVALVFFSWVTNFVRIGTLVLCVHDAVDYFLAGAKMANYAKREVLSTALFVVFLVVWILTRLIIFPFFVIYSASIESTTVPGLLGCPSHTFFNVLLYVLQVLHIVWTYMILRIAKRKLTAGEMKDVRSDSEESDEEPIEELPKHKSEENGFHSYNNSPRTRSKARGHQ